MSRKKKKRCCRCRVLKLVTEFPPCTMGKDGLYSYCRLCHSEYQKARHPNRKEIDEKKARRIGLKKQGLKTCRSCKAICPLSYFYNDPRHTDGKQSICKDCWNVRGNTNYLKKEYDITVDEFHQLLEAQDGCCAICDRPPKKYRFNIDHCHKTHLIRALLCVNCNTNLLPLVEAHPDWVKQAFDYIENPPAFKVIGKRQVPKTNQVRRKKKEVTDGNMQEEES